MTSERRRTRADCPLCGKNMTVSNLRYVHVCGKRGGRPKRSEKDQVALAVEAVTARMAKLSLAPGRRGEEMSEAVADMTLSQLIPTAPEEQPP